MRRQQVRLMPYALCLLSLEFARELGSEARRVAVSAPWRYVIAGTSDCLACGAVLDASCSYSDPDEGR